MCSGLRRGGRSLQAMSPSRSPRPAVLGSGKSPEVASQPRSVGLPCPLLNRPIHRHCPVTAPRRARRTRIFCAHVVSCGVLYRDRRSHWRGFLPISDLGRSQSFLLRKIFDRLRRQPVCRCQSSWRSGHSCTRRRWFDRGVSGEDLRSGGQGARRAGGDVRGLPQEGRRSGRGGAGEILCLCDLHRNRCIRRPRGADHPDRSFLRFDDRPGAAFAALAKITLLSAGAGAGIAATFNTPLGGVLFAVEMLLPEVSNRTFLPVVVATATATYVGRIAFGLDPAFIVPISAEEVSKPSRRSSWAPIHCSASWPALPPGLSFARSPGARTCSPSSREMITPRTSSAC